MAADQQSNPPEELQDKIHFLFNNLSSTNLQEKVRHSDTQSESSSSSSSSSSSKSVSKSTTPTPTPHPHLNKYFRMLLLELLKMFNSSKTLLERKGSFIIRYE